MFPFMLTGIGITNPWTVKILVLSFIGELYHKISQKVDRIYLSAIGQFVFQGY